MAAPHTKRKSERQQLACKAAANGSTKDNAVNATQHKKPEVESQDGGIVLRRISEVATSKVSWLWPGRVAYGALTVLDGESNLGKSTIAAALIADVTGGPLLPGNKPHEPQAAMILCHEMGMGNQIKGRLHAAGAKLNRCYFPEENGLRDQLAGVSFPANQEWLEEMIKAHKIGFVLADPLSDFVSDGFDLNNEQQARKVVGGLQKAGQRTAAAIFAIRHPRKQQGGGAINQGLGSKGIVAVARVVLRVDRHNAIKDWRCLSVVKCNLGEKARTLNYSLEKTKGSVRIKIEGESDENAEDLAAGPESPGEKDVMAVAIEFLKKQLANGPVASKLLKKMAEDAMIPQKKLWAAKEKLGIDARPVSLGGEKAWKWFPPKDGWPKGV